MEEEGVDRVALSDAGRDRGSLARIWRKTVLSREKLRW
jgi:hypothetical protein